MSESTPMLCTPPQTLLMTHLRSSAQPRLASSLLPLPLASFMKTPPPYAPPLSVCHTLQLFHFRSRGLQQFASQPPDCLRASWKPQPILVRSALARLNIEPFSCCKRCNKFLLQSLLNALWFKRPKSPRLLFRSPIC